MRRLIGVTIFLGFFVLSGAAQADTQFKPDFPCPRPDNSDVLATAICGDSYMVKAELEMEGAYYAAR